MVYWLVLPSAELDSPTKWSTLSLRLDTIFLEPKPSLRQRMIRPLLVPSLISSNWTRKSGVLVILRYSSGLVFSVSWRKLVKTKLEVFSHGFKLELEERLLVCNSRNCRIRNLLC